MPLIPTPNQLQQDASLLDNLILQTAEATHHLAATIARCNAEFWGLPDDRLAAILNADVERTQAVFAANSALGSAVNASLDEIDSPAHSCRAPVTPGREISLGLDGKFTITPHPIETTIEP